MSLVALVIREDVWNFDISALENFITLEKTWPLRSRPILAPTLDAKNETNTDITIIRPAIRNIISPQCQR